jgi:PPOX class probable F420-dependent enzyme
VPTSYGVSRDESGLGEDAWTQVGEMLSAARNYWLGTTRPDGRPHAMPVWGVWLDDMFWFATDRRSRKGRNLARKPALVVHLESGDNVVVLEGIAEEVVEPSLFTRFADAYEKKYQWRLQGSKPGEVTYRVRPRVAFTWRERDFPQTATRWFFGEG